jgi:hypothetical protein
VIYRFAMLLIGSAAQETVELRVSIRGGSRGTFRMFLRCNRLQSDRGSARYSAGAGEGMFGIVSVCNIR